MAFRHTGWYTKLNDELAIHRSRGRLGLLDHPMLDLGTLVSLLHDYYLYRQNQEAVLFLLYLY